MGLQELDTTKLLNHFKWVVKYLFSIQQTVFPLTFWSRQENKPQKQANHNGTPLPGVAHIQVGLRATSEEAFWEMTWQSLAEGISTVPP